MKKVENKEDKYKLEIIMTWNSLGNFTYGYQYDKNDIMESQYFGVTNIHEAWAAVKQIVKVDSARLRDFIFGEVKYIYRGFREIYIGQKRMFVASFVAVSSVLLTAATIAYNQEPLVGKQPDYIPTTVNCSFTPMTSTNTVKEISKITGVKPIKFGKNKPKLKKVKDSELLVGKKSYSVGDVIELLPVKSVTDLVPIKSLKAIEDIDIKLAYNPSNLVETFDGSYAKDLGSPIDKGIKKFNSYEEGVLYLFKLIVEHNQNSEKKISVLTTLGQIVIESNLRPKNGGYTSALSSFGNNFIGIKTLNKSTPGFHLKDDDTDKHGKLIESKFIIFNNPKECISHFADFIYKPRYTKGKYTNGRYIFTDNLSFYDYKQCIKDLKGAGYCTLDSYPKLVAKVIETEVIPVLKKNNKI